MSDPVIHDDIRHLQCFRMDCRVKPGNDEAGTVSGVQRSQLPISRSYSACDPIQNQTILLSSSTARAR